VGAGGGGVFNSPRTTLRERSNTKGNLKTKEKTLRNSRPLGKRPSTTQQKRRGASIH